MIDFALIDRHYRICIDLSFKILYTFEILDFLLRTESNQPASPTGFSRSLQLVCLLLDEKKSLEWNQDAVIRIHYSHHYLTEFSRCLFLDK